MVSGTWNRYDGDFTTFYGYHDKAFSIKLTLDEKRLLDEIDSRPWAREALVRADSKKR
jgi:hypothetical protein